MSSDAFSAQCSDILSAKRQSEEVAEVEGVFHKIDENPVGTRAKIIKALNSFMRKFVPPDEMARLIIAQTYYLSKVRRGKEVVKYYEDFPETGMRRTGAPHNIFVQTAYLSKVPISKLFEILEEVPRSEGVMHDLARVMIMQTSVFSGRPVLEVVDFMEKAEKIHFDHKSMSYHLILQTAFLTNRSVSEVGERFRSLPYIPTRGLTAGLAVIHQTIFMTKERGAGPDN